MHYYRRVEKIWLASNLLNGRHGIYDEVARRRFEDDLGARRHCLRRKAADICAIVDAEKTLGARSIRRGASLYS